MHCQVETLRRCFPPSIRRALDELPNTLDETYKRTLLGIDKEKRDYAYRIFQCLAVSIRPLRVEELAEIFAIQPTGESTPRFDPSWRPENPEEFVLSACSALVTVVNVNGDRLVQFSHFSVREYLTSNRIADSEHLSQFHILRQPAHTLLARVCLSVLLQLDDRINKAKIQNFPMALYAAQHWVDHAQFEDVSSDIQDGMERLFDKDKPHFAAWIWIYDMDGFYHMSTARPEQPDAVPLYYAALCGFRNVAEYLIDTHPQDVGSWGGLHGTPLLAALNNGHVDIALLLLERGVNVCPLELRRASECGYAEVVRELINRGEDPNTEDEHWKTLLWFASKNGQLETARVLLEHGADVNRSDEYERTPLHLASQNGHDHVVRLLLDHSAYPNEYDTSGDTSLHRASLHGGVMVVMILLEYGANVDAENLSGETPLHYASEYGHLEVVRLLLDRGADVNSQAEVWPTDKLGNTPLCEASRGGHLEIVRLLLDRGADVNRQGCPHWPDSWGETPLHVASQEGYLEIARLLLDRGADVNAQSKICWTALHVAADGGRLQLVELLISRGGDPHVRNQDGATPLLLASRNNHMQVVRLLSGSAGEGA